MHRIGCIAAFIFFSRLLPAALGQPLGVLDSAGTRTSLHAQQGLLFGDFDADDDVDLYDHFTLHICITMSGPGVAASPACLTFDSDAENDVDLADFAAFQNVFTGDIPPVCGDGKVETGEECDDGNTDVADGCNATCQIEIENDYCINPNPLAEGSLTFSTVGATTDGPNELLDCNFFGTTEVLSDIWYCYTATCTGPVVITLCGSDYDTKMAVYAGCGCPSSRPIACSDDDCGTAFNNDQSRVTIEATAGESYMVRVGGYPGSREQGEGLLTVRCGPGTCGEGAGSCTSAHGANLPGCDDAACCNRVCEVDRFCCDVTWNAFCAAEAGGFCSGSGFPSCNAEAGTCDHPQNSPGCENVDCCNAVCESDPSCCIDRWDTDCVNRSEVLCANCGPGRGDCSAARLTPGCEDVSCCGKVCSVDSFCCTAEWDLTCAQEAGYLCN